MFRGRVVFDYETTGLKPHDKGTEIFLAGVEDEQGKVLMVEPGTKEFEKVVRVLEDPKVEKEGWNVKYEHAMSRKHKIKVQGVVHDAMLKTYMNNEYEPNLKLKDCARRHLKEPGLEEQEVKAFIAKKNRTLKKLGIEREANYSDVPRPIMRKYLEKDLDDTMRMGWKMRHVETGPQRRVYDIERELILNVVKMEERGVRFDLPYCRSISKDLQPRIAALREEMFAQVGCRFNPNSRQQLDKVLRSLGIDTEVLNEDETMATGVLYLQPLRHHAFINTLLEYRCLIKLEGTYFSSFLEKADEDGIIHPSFWPFGQDKGIKTGRFSMSEPNLQNIPAGKRSDNLELKKNSGLVRRALIPRPGYVFLLGDYKQIEFVIFACNAGDAHLLADLRSGMDFHLANAYRIFGRNCMEGFRRRSSTFLSCMAWASTSSRSAQGDHCLTRRPSRTTSSVSSPPCSIS